MKLQRPEKFNVALAQTVLNHVTLHPEMHNQAIVMNSCNTAGCIAGWIWVLDKGEPMPEAIICGSGNRMDDAQDILGLTTREADQLFSGVITERMAVKMLADMIRQATKHQSHARRRADKAEEKRQREIDEVARFQVKVAAYFHSARKIRRLSRKSKATI